MRAEGVGGDPAGGGRARDVHAGLFRVLLRLYPPGFRQAYGVEMTNYFVQRVARAGRRVGGRAGVGAQRRGRDEDGRRRAP